MVVELKVIVGDEENYDVTKCLNARRLKTTEV